MIPIACKKTPVKEWTQEQVEEWFSATQWSKLGFTLDASTDKFQLAEQIIENPESWAAALRFLKETNLDSLAEGRYDLLNDGTYAMVTSYMTRQPQAFEAHRKYIDIQHMISGCEYIDVAPLGHVTEYTQVYDPERDIEFFEKESYTRLTASSDNFMIFFPTDAHRPCIHTGTCERVKKVVVKIPYVTLPD